MNSVLLSMQASSALATQSDSAALGRAYFGSEAAWFSRQALQAARIGGLSVHEQHSVDRFVQRHDIVLTARSSAPSIP